MAKKPLGNIKTIIFDLDGTLIDAYSAIESSFNFTMRKLGLPTQKKTIIRKAVGWGDGMLLAPFVPKSILPSALNIYRQHHKKSLVAKAKLFPAAINLLRKFSKKYYLAVASNRPTKFSNILLKSLKLNKYFDFIICADKLKKGKPHPLILQKIIKKLKVKPKEALFVGDMAIDAQTAKRARVKAIIVRTGSSSLEEIRKERPYKIISSIKELEDYLKTNK
ncbi:MAG: HAD family hydrolase [Candidatus Omnitrophota bacterium]